jgi:membrane protein
MWVWVTPGSLVATLLWLIGSIGFRFYAVNFANYQATYGAVGGVILLLLWFYLSGLVFVIGAEMKEDRARLALGQGAGREGAGRQGATVGLIIGASMQAWLRPDR